VQNISESLKRQREQILQDGSEEMLNRHTSLLEIAIISLYNRLVNSLKVDAVEFRSSGAVIGMGAFGRGLIGPRQPVSILILMAESSPWEDGWINEIADPMKEAGWQVELETGRISRLLERAQDDFEFFLRLLEGRYISGTRQLVDRLDDELEALIDKNRESFLLKLYKSVQSRNALLQIPESWLEPDLAKNPGGLLDIGAIRLACRIASHIRCLEDAIFQGYLNRQEVDFLQQAEKKFTRLLSLVRALNDDSTSLLRFEEQELLGNQLGYSARVGFLPVEAFMQEIHRLLHGVSCVSQEFWERLQESRWHSAAEDDSQADSIETGLSAKYGKIQLQSELYPATAGHLVHLFHIAAREKLGFTNITRQWIYHHRNVLDTAAGDAMVKEELLGLIRADEPELPVVRRLYNLGLLTSLIPELAAVHGLVQHDAFHLYPIQEHHMCALAELKRLFAGFYQDSEPELTKIAGRVEDPTMVFLAGLLHDIGKSAGRDHALHGGEMIPSIARRLGLSSEESDTLQFLVAQHLLLMDSASLRDLADEEMLAQCALITKTPQQLDLLMLLSFADMMATGPRAQQKLRDTPVLALHERVYHLLEKGEPSPQAIADRIDQVRIQVEQEVADLISKPQLENYFEQLAPRYLLSMPPSAIAKHIRMEWQLQHSQESLIWETTASDGLADVTLLSKESPGLLARAAGILALRDLNIISAQVFTKRDGVVLLIFQCRWPEDSNESPDWELAKKDMKRVLEGKMSLEYRIAAHASKRKVLGQSLSRPSPSRVLIDNESTQLYTILEVYTTDRVGLLYTITRTLWELQVRIYVAKITTKVDQVADVFYIKSSKGDKVTDPEQIEEIKKALLFWLDGGDAEQDHETRKATESVSKKLSQVTLRHSGERRNPVF